MKSLFAFFALAACALGANPYVNLPDDQAVSSTYTGKEWGDEINSPTEEGADFSARVTLQRLASMPWGQIVKISFAPKSERMIQPLHFLVTDGQILELLGADLDKEIKSISEMKKQPAYAKNDVRALNRGGLNFQDGPWTTQVKTSGGTCTFLSSHNSGHFTKLVWKKGAGLVEYSWGRGALADGFRLKAPAAK